MNWRLGSMVVLLLSWQAIALPTIADMSPILSQQQQTGQPYNISSLEFLAQMQNPSEIFSIVLLVGGEVVQTAIAQMTGRRITLVAFSFGWVTYAINSLRSAFGYGTFMPVVDYDSVVINAKSGIRRTNESWLLGRLIRDLEREVEATFETWTEDVDEKGKLIKKKANTGDTALLVTMFEAQEGGGRPELGWCIVNYFVTLLMQLIVAAIPIALYRDWSIILVTTAGTVLAILTGSLRGWWSVKYPCRRNATNPYILTRGNGHKHVFVVFSSRGCGLNLEDLACAKVSVDRLTRILSVVLTILWIMFLLTAGGIKANTWYLLLVGALGMIQNVAVAGTKRSSATHGIPLLQDGAVLGQRTKTGGPMKLMKTLYQLEDACFAKGIKGIGLAVRREFFPDHALTPHELLEWEMKGNR